MLAEHHTAGASVVIVALVQIFIINALPKTVVILLDE
jgi:hypothetical protein